MTLPDKSFLIFYAANQASGRFIFSGKYTKGVSGYTSGIHVKISESEIKTGERLYSSKTHDQGFWLVWKDKAGGHIFRQRFDSSGELGISKTTVFPGQTGMLEIYGASGPADAGSVEKLNITYKKTEYGIEQIYVALFNYKGNQHRSPFIIHSGVPDIEDIIILHRNTYKYLTLTVGTGPTFDSDGKGIQARNIALIGPTDITETLNNPIPDDKRLV